MSVDNDRITLKYEKCRSSQARSLHTRWREERRSAGTCHSSGSIRSQPSSMAILIFLRSGFEILPASLRMAAGEPPGGNARGPFFAFDITMFISVNQKTILLGSSSRMYQEHALSLERE